MNKKQRTIYNRFKKEVEEEKRRKEEDHICWACGRNTEVNSCGICKDCWIQFSYLRDIDFGRNKKCKKQ